MRGASRAFGFPAASSTRCVSSCIGPRQYLTAHSSSARRRRPAWLSRSPRSRTARSPWASVRTSFRSLRHPLASSRKVRAMAMQVKTSEQGSLTRDIKYTEMVFGVSELRQDVVTEAPMLRGRRWRHQFNEKVLPAIEGLMRAQDLEFDNTEDLANLMPLVTGLLSDIIDDV